MTVRALPRIGVLCFFLVTTAVNTVAADTTKATSESAFQVFPITTLEGRLPRLTAERGGAVLSWVTKGERGNALLAARLRNGDMEPPVKVTEGEQWFLNPFDRPSVVALSEAVLAGHWLERNSSSIHGYGVRIKFSLNNGKTWGETIIPHADRAPVQHGFVHLRAASSRSVHALWLDGGKTGAASPSTSEPMALLSAQVDASGRISKRTVLDERVCTCCQPALQSTGKGWIAAYRDRSPSEVRDISVVAAGQPLKGDARTTFDDGWVIAGCPLNGPALSVQGAQVTIAWFTAADDRPQVRLSFSDDGGHSFGKPQTVATDTPLGQVSAVTLEDGSALVSWLEFNGAGLELRVRQLFADPGKPPTESHVVVRSSRTIAAPQMTCSEGHIYLAWEVMGTNRTQLAHLESNVGSCTR